VDLTGSDSVHWHAVVNVVINLRAP